MVKWNIPDEEKMIAYEALPTIYLKLLDKLHV